MEAFDATITGDLLIPAAGSPKFVATNPLAGRLDYIEAVLADGGWVVSDEDETDPLLRTSEVARLLNLSETYTRRLMEAGTIACETRPVGPTKTQRFARHSAVTDYVESLGDRRVLANLAEEYGLPYHQTRNLLLRLFPDVAVCPQTREFLLTDEHTAGVRAEVERVRALHARSMRSAAAAHVLGTGRETVIRLANKGVLERDEETDSSGAVYVTRDSVDAELCHRSQSRNRVPGDEVLLDVNRPGFDGGSGYWIPTPAGSVCWAA